MDILEGSEPTDTRFWGLRAGGVPVILDSMLEVSGEPGVFDPESQIDHGADYIDRVAGVGNEAVHQLGIADQHLDPTPGSS